MTLVRLAVLGALFACAGTARAQAPRLTRGTGTYRNVDYGYVVRLPAGTTYERSPAPFPNHGFQVPLAAGDTLWVDASYTDSLTLDGAVRELVSIHEGCAVTANRATRLGGLAAREVVYRCQPERRGGRTHEWREVVALRGAILYTVGIRRTGALSREGAGLFAAARAGFATTPR